MGGGGAHCPAMHALVQQSAATMQGAPAERHAGTSPQEPVCPADATHASEQHCPANEHGAGSPSQPTAGAQTSVPPPFAEHQPEQHWLDASHAVPVASRLQGAPSGRESGGPSLALASFAPPSFVLPSMAPSTVASAAPTPASRSGPGARTSSVAGAHPVRITAAAATSSRTTEAILPLPRTEIGAGGTLVIVVAKPDNQPRPTGPSDAALVVAARAGEDWAREALFRRYSRMVFGLCYRLVGRDEEIDNLVQECFVQALSHLGRLSEPQAFAAWLTSVVVRTTHKALRRRTLATRIGLRSRREPVDGDSLVSPSAPADVVAELRAVYRVIDALPTRVRVALVLRRVEGMSQDEVAAAMGVSVSTAKRLIVEAELCLDSALRDSPPRRRT